MSFAEKLNQFDVSFDLTEKGVSLEATPADEDEGAAEKLLDETFVWVDYHPYGRDGGLVVRAKYRGKVAWYDSTGECCWVDL